MPRGLSLTVGEDSMSWTEVIRTRRTNASRLYRPPLVKGSTPDRDVTPTESEQAGSDHGGSGVEEGEAQEEGESYIGSRSRDSVEGDRHGVGGHHTGAGVLEECPGQGLRGRWSGH